MQLCMPTIFGLNRLRDGSANKLRDVGANGLRDVSANVLRWVTVRTDWDVHTSCRSILSVFSCWTLALANSVAI